jgi:hypothetical protein
MDTTSKANADGIGMMARRDSDIATLREEFNAIVERDGSSVIAAAFAMEVPADELRDFLQGDKDFPQIANRVRRFIEERNAQWNAVREDQTGKAFDAALRGHVGELVDVLNGFVSIANAKMTANAETAWHVAMSHVKGVLRLFEVCNEPGACWRCGANLRPPPAEVEIQIKLNENAAAWSGWPLEIFREKCRAVMRQGDRIVGIRGGAVVVRRSDGALLEVGRWDG